MPKTLRTVTVDPLPLPGHRLPERSDRRESFEGHAEIVRRVQCFGVDAPISDCTNSLPKHRLTDIWHAGTDRGDRSMECNDDRPCMDKNPYMYLIHACDDY